MASDEREERPREPAHEDVIELLPWLVNGTLSGAERERVERHVRSCLPCRAALKSEQRLAALVQAQPTVRLSPERGFEELLARADRPAARRAGLGFAPRRAALLAAGLAAAAVVAWLGLPDARDAGEFTTLTAGARTDALRVDVVFAPGASEADVRALVRDIGGTIVAGPSEIGRYTVQLHGDAHDVDAAIERLRGDERVMFAGRSFDGGPGP
ncbi:MAG TPA: zf-HC2 domain-containing protein [Gammaproteobacteria bacterium]